MRLDLLFIPSICKSDRSGMVAFHDINGCRVKFFVSQDSAEVPSPTRQKFECIFTGKLESIDRKAKTATAYAKLVRNIPVMRIPTFEEKAAAATAKIAPPPAHDMGKTGDLLSILISKADNSSSRSKRHKRHVTGTKKGPSEKAAIGAGNSKKSKHARRKRQRLANAA